LRGGGKRDNEKSGERTRETTAHGDAGFALSGSRPHKNEQSKKEKTR